MQEYLFRSWHIFWSIHTLLHLSWLPCWPLIVHGKMGSSHKKLAGELKIFVTIKAANIVLYPGVLSCKPKNISTWQFLRMMAAVKIAGKMIQDDRGKRGQPGKSISYTHQRFPWKDMRNVSCHPFPLYFLGSFSIRVLFQQQQSSLMASWKIEQFGFFSM